MRLQSSCWTCGVLHCTSAISFLSCPGGCDKPATNSVWSQDQIMSKLCKSPKANTSYPECLPETRRRRFHPALQQTGGRCASSEDIALESYTLKTLRQALWAKLLRHRVFLLPLCRRCCFIICLSLCASLHSQALHGVQAPRCRLCASSSRAGR